MRQIGLWTGVLVVVLGLVAAGIAGLRQLSQPAGPLLTDRSQVVEVARRLAEPAWRAQFPAVEPQCLAHPPQVVVERDQVKVRYHFTVRQGGRITELQTIVLRLDLSGEPTEPIRCFHRVYQHSDPPPTAEDESGFL